MTPASAGLLLAALCRAVFPSLSLASTGAPHSGRRLIVGREEKLQLNFDDIMMVSLEQARSRLRIRAAPVHPPSQRSGPFGNPETTLQIPGLVPVDYESGLLNYHMEH